MDLSAERLRGRLLVRQPLIYRAPSAGMRGNTWYLIFGDAKPHARLCPTQARKGEEKESAEAQLFAAGARGSFAAIVTNSASEVAFIFRIILPRCAFTVISLMPSSKATCLFNRPETTNAMT